MRGSTFFVSEAEAAQDDRPSLAQLIGADYSARAITPQSSDQAPDVVRRALTRYAPYDARTGVDFSARWKVVDRGNARAISASTWEEAFSAIEAHADQALNTKTFVVALGGDHSVSWPLVTAAAKHARDQKIAVVQLDVHHDVRSLEHGPSNGTPFRGLIESKTLPSCNLVQIGIHPFANRRELAEYCSDQEILRFTVDDVDRLGAGEIATVALRALRDACAIWLSVDIDVLDRAFAPGTVAALSGGLNPATLLTMVHDICRDPRVIGMDVVEFDPKRDVADITASAVANVVMESLSAVANRSS